MSILNIAAKTALPEGWPIAVWPAPDAAAQVVIRRYDDWSLCEFDDQVQLTRDRTFDGRLADVARGPDGTRWVATDSELRRLGNDLSLSEVIHEADGGMELCAVAFVDEDLLIVQQHDLDEPQSPGTISRLTVRGEVLWKTALEPAALEYSGVVEMRRVDGWKPRSKDAWEPDTWLQSGDVVVRGDRGILAFSEMPRTGIGFAYVVRLTDGQVLYTTEKGPVSEMAAFSEGRFLVGYQGYGAFRTLLYGPHGQVEDEWPSHGHYIVTDEGVRVVERENTRSRRRLVALEPGGRVRRGFRLPSYNTSTPLVRNDGSMLFVRNGAVFLCRGLSIVDTTPIPEADHRSSGTEAVAVGSAAFVAVEIERWRWELLCVDVADIDDSK